MIVLTKNNEIEIPNYDDLDNKPKINGVTLEGNKTAAELGIEVDTNNFYTKTQSDNKFQPKGNYLTSVPSEYVTESELTNKDYATKTWVNNQCYLTSIPSEYVTEIELNDAIAGLGGSTDIPTVVISNGDANSTTPTVTSGDLDAVINAISENAPYIAYFVNVGTKYGVNGKKYIIQAADFNALTDTGALYYHTEIDGGNHMDVQIFFRKENDVYIVFNITRQYHYYQEQLYSGVNIKTINGNSILGSGNIEITTDLSSYATTSYVENNYQPKGNYLTSIPTEYVTETELNDAIAGLGDGESVAYLIVKENTSENTYSYVGGSFEDVVNAYNNNKPYFIYVPNGAGVDYYSLGETTIISGTTIQCLSFAHTGTAHTWRYWRLYSDRPTLYRQTTYEYATTSYVDTQIGDINTILENIIG